MPFPALMTYNLQRTCSTTYARNTASTPNASTPQARATAADLLTHSRARSMAMPSPPSPWRPQLYTLIPLRAAVPKVGPFSSRTATWTTSSTTIPMSPARADRCPTSRSGSSGGVSATAAIPLATAARPAISGALMSHAIRAEAIVTSYSTIRFLIWTTAGPTDLGRTRILTANTAQTTF